MKTTDRTLFARAVERFKSGDRKTAHKYMRQVLLEDPGNIQAWLWMSAMVDDTHRQRDCLERALAIDPTCEAAIKGLEILRLRESVEALAGGTQPLTQPSKRQVRKIGDYLVERHFINEKQLRQALDEQKDIMRGTQGIRVPIGNILVKHGLLTPQMLATVLVQQQQDKLFGDEKHPPQYLGEYLVSRELITPKQLEIALAEQIRLRQQGKEILLGELLVYAGYITPDSLESVLAQQRDALFERFGFGEDSPE